LEDTREDRARAGASLFERALAAERLIREHVRETPLEHSPVLSERLGCETFLKLENFQETGSFKLRGVLSKLMSMDEAELGKGIVTASTGNHGLATAHAARLLGLSAEIVVPEGARGFRLDKLIATGVTTSVHGTECAEAESWARAEAERTGRVYVPPYSDIDVVAGQGTVAIELLRQCDSVDLLAATVGGGGLVAGVAGALKDAGLATVALGCLPEASPAMYESVLAGHVVRTEVLPTLSDSSAGNVEEGAITLELCGRYVDEWVLVPERGILDAMRLLCREHDMVVEGAAGVAVCGAMMAGPGLRLNRESRAVVIICGGNVSPSVFADVLDCEGE